MKRLKFMMLLAMVPLVVACNGGGETSATSSGGEATSSTGGGGDISSTGGDTASPSSGGGDSTSSGIDRSDFVWTITFDSQGGSAVPSQEVKDGERAVEPADPSYEGYVFQGWYKDIYAVTPFDFETAITADWTLYAGWQRSLDPVTSSSQGGSSSSGSSQVTPSSDPYGPEGSELVDWYIVGEGASFSGWNTAGGIKMYSNPSSTYGDLACILNVTFAVGDVFKITDGGSNWYGYLQLQTGKEYFEEIEPDSNHNIGVVTAGSYDVYLNNSGLIYVSAHAS